MTVPCLLEFRDSYPDVALSVVEGISSTIYEQVLSGRLDVGIVLSVESMQGLQHRPLFAETLFLVGQPGTLPDTDRISLEMLATQPLVLTQRANAMRAVLEKALREAKVSCRCIVEADSTRLQTALIAGARDSQSCHIVPLPQTWRRAAWKRRRSTHSISNGR
ncbi:LysR substrate-binding domain-containing protein [Cupriavidus basilensis]